MAQWIRGILPVLPLLAVIGGIMAFVVWSQQPGRFPLRVIEIQDALKWTPLETIQQVVSEQASQGFFGLEVEALQAKLNLLPWIISASVQRIWPDRLLISLKEQTPLARFNEQGILSTEGQIFYPDLTNISVKLPQFKGPVELKPEVYAKEMLNQYLTLLELLSPLGLGIAELQLSAEGGWRVMLDNGIAIILGKSALNERLGRFALVYANQLQNEIHKVAYLDLRYTNGLAIGWKASVQVP